MNKEKIDKNFTESRIFKFGSDDKEIILNLSNNKTYLLFNIQDNTYFPPLVFEAFLSFKSLQEKNEIFLKFKSTYDFVGFLEECNNKKNMTIKVKNKESAFLVIKDSSFEEELNLEIQKKKKVQPPSSKSSLDNNYINSKLEIYEKEISSLKDDIKLLKEKSLLFEKQISQLIKNQNNNYNNNNNNNNNNNINNPNNYNINSDFTNINNENKSTTNNSNNNNIPQKQITKDKHLQSPLKTISESEILKSSEISLLSSWIKEDSEIKYTLLFSTKINGDNSSTFHLLCDDKFPTLTLIKTKTGFRFGGYTTMPWKSDSLVFYKDDLAFLFSLDKKMKYLPENSEEAICCISGCGPTFGASDLTIRNECTKNCNSFCQGPQSYIMDKAELTGGVEKFVVECYEVYLIEF